MIESCSISLGHAFQDLVLVHACMFHASTRGRVSHMVRNGILAKRGSFIGTREAFDKGLVDSTWGSAHLVNPCDASQI
eukprot:COSAG01_NODE_16589_length_1223_cov_1.323843_1_plen_78_part_00